MKRFTTILFFFAAASQMGATDCGQALRDPGFDLWCGDHMCAWQVERGSAAEVDTWHAGDHGVALIGDDVAIDQLSPVASTDGTCLEFDVIANVDVNVDAELNIDVFGDGSDEVTERLPAGTWQPLKYQVRMPDTYAGVRFEITKRGAGSAELANIGAQIVQGGCVGQPAMIVNARPDGAVCDTGTPGECTSGICGISGVLASEFSVPMCLECDADHACGSGQVCGSVPPASALFEPPTACIAPASHLLGQQCAADNDCASGHCNEFMCSTCGGNADCASGETCAPAWNIVESDGLTAINAWECAPGAGKRTIGQPCIANGDCASGACAGAALSTCEDGRACATADDCPFDGDLINSACTLVGVQGGSCH